MRITIVYNPRAGGAFSKKNLANLFMKHGILVEKWVALGEVDDTKLRGVVAVVGGDGTISKVAAKLSGTKTILAPLPGGTLNHFTKDLGISQNIDEAIAGLTAGKTRQVDIASVNGRYFINNSSLGLYPSSLSAREKLEYKFGKWLAMVIASFYAFFHFRTYTFTIEKESFSSPFIFVGNNPYKLDQLGVATRESLLQGTLSICIAKTASRAGILKIALLTLMGVAHLLDEFDIRTAKTVTVKSSHRRQLVSLDGELTKLHSPLKYEIHPKHLRIRY